jgi:hypothetical protein
LNRSGVAYLIEINIALAVGFSLARHFFNLRHDGWVVVGAALTGVALVEGPAVWAERWRRSGPPSWGLGRATWSLAGAVSVAYVGLDGLRELFREPSWHQPAQAAWGFLWSLREATDYPVVNLMPWCLPALYLTYRVSGWPQDATKDAREWGGRLYAIVVVILYLLDREFELINLDSAFEAWRG